MTALFRARLMATPPHLRPLGALALGDERPPRAWRVALDDGHTVVNVSSGMIQPTEHGMIGGAARLAVREWRKVENNE